MIRINLIGEKKKQSKKKSGGGARVKLEGMSSGNSGLLVGILLVGA